MGNGTNIGRVRGLGSARSGAHHWWLERLTSVASLFLTLWLVVSLVSLPLSDHATVLQWLQSPIVAVPMLLLILGVFWHLKLGLQVFIEDYVHEKGNLVAALIALNFFTLGAGAAAVFFVLKIAFGGVPA